MKKISTCMMVTLGLCLTTIGIKPASSSELINTDSEEIVISQLRGHNTYDGGSQMQWNDYSLGKVVGKSGGWMSILVEDGTSFQAQGSVRPGSDVLVAKDENGEYYLVSAAESEWISILQSEYGWKRFVAQGALNERTAAIWQEIEASSSRSVVEREIPPREVGETQFEPEPMMDSEPVRGLW